MSKPKLDGLETLFKRGKDFSLTDAQYKDKTGTCLPKDKSYLRNKSALSKRAHENGYTIEVVEIVERKVLFHKEA